MRADDPDDFPLRALSGFRVSASAPRTLNPLLTISCASFGASE
jgi:hypothetical protein